MSERDGPTALLHVRAWLVRANQSLFLLPAAIIAGGAALAVAVDLSSSGIPKSDVPSHLRIGSNAATTLLSTIAGATITTVGVVFSIVVLSVQLASGQFSPRIVRNFFADRRSQFTVGILAATFTYCVLVLFSVSGASSNNDAVPLFAVGIAVVLGITSILAIVAFLNHSARRLYVGNLTERVTRQTLELIEAMQSTDDADGSTVAAPTDATVVRARDSGWVQQVSWQALADAVPDGSCIRFEARAGAYVVAGTPLALVWPSTGDEHDLEAAVNNAVIVGSERTMQQDIDFGLRQLSDIALRALSPSINDPHTAIEVVFRHATILRRLLTTTLPPRVYRRADVTVHRPHELAFEDYVEHGLADIRRFGAEHPSVALVLVRTCTMLVEAAEDEGRPELGAEPRRQLRLVLEGAEHSGWVDDDLVMLRAAAGAAAG
jgi:uncharacterized membrane protein